MLIVREDEPEKFTVVRAAESVRDANGVHQRWSITRDWSDEELAAVGLYRVQEISVPRGRTGTTFTIERVDDAVQQVWTLGNIVDDLTAYAADKRWQTETGGMITSFGVPVVTDRESQSMITGAFNFLMHNPDRTVFWKMSPTEFIQLGVDQMTAIATEVGKHIQDCFALEHSINERIVNGEITDADQIDAEFKTLSP